MEGPAGYFAPTAEFVIPTGAKRSGGTCWLRVQSLFMAPREHGYYVYIVASISRVLYCGITNSIWRRVEEHRTGTFTGFSADYNCKRLVWYERFQYVGNAIAREKQIKRWRREKKVWLITQANPFWIDLSEEWRVQTAGPSTTLRSGRDDKV